jgi:RND family efflux transporter MFP subunit
MQKLRKTWIWTAVALLVLAGGSFILFSFLQAPKLASQILYGNGYIEGTEIRISAELSGRVLNAPFSEGTTISKGELLCEIDTAELQLQSERAVAQLTAIDHEKAITSDKLKIWRHHLASAQKDHERHLELHERGNISDQKLDQTADQLEEAKGQVNVLEAQTKEVAARYDAAVKTMEIIEVQLRKARITAPLDATVLVKAVESGELLMPGQVVAVLMDLTKMDLKVYIPEKEIAKVKLGNIARIRVDAFPDRHFQATVKRVDQRAQFTPVEIHVPEERVRMVFGVTLAIENPEGLLKPGMPADAWILWHENTDWPDKLFIPQ